jgi:hypothetical protein
VVTFQSIQTQDEIDFDRGYEAYYAGEETLRNVNPDVKDGYREAWYEDNRSIGRNRGDNFIDEVWEEHWETIKEV